MRVFSRKKIRLTKYLKVYNIFFIYITLEDIPINFLEMKKGCVKS